MNEILEKLKQQNERTIDIWIPSLEQHQQFKLLTLKQQKELVRTELDPSLTGINLALTFNEIITQNSVEKKDYLITDKPSILVALRANSFSSTWHGRELTPIKVDIEKWNNTCTYANIGVVLRVPTISQENRFYQHCIDQTKKITNPGDLAVSVYSYAIAKYIESITIEDITIQSEQLTISDLLKIIDNFPVKLNEQLTEAITDSINYEKKYLTYGDEVIDLDVAFFTKND